MSLSLDSYVLISYLVSLSLLCFIRYSIESKDPLVLFRLQLLQILSLKFESALLSSYTTRLKFLSFSLQSVRPTPQNDAITVHFKPVTLKASESKYTKVASISFDGKYSFFLPLSDIILIN